MATYAAKNKGHVIRLPEPKDTAHINRVGTALREVSDSLAKTRRRIERALDKERSNR